MEAKSMTSSSSISRRRSKIRSTAGWPPERARAEAERRFGDRRRHRRNLNDINRSLQRRRTRFAVWDAMRQNVRDAARGLRRTPGMSAAVIILLALGIGANATMFEIVDRLLLRPPDHLVDADRLRLLYSQRPTLTLPRLARSYSDVADLKGLPALEAVSAFTPRRRMTTGTGAEARRIQVQMAEASCSRRWACGRCWGGSIAPPKMNRAPRSPP